MLQKLPAQTDTGGDAVSRKKNSHFPHPSAEVTFRWGPSQRKSNRKGKKVKHVPMTIQGEK